MSSGRATSCHQEAFQPRHAATPRGSGGGGGVPITLGDEAKELLPLP